MRIRMYMFWQYLVISPLIKVGRLGSGDGDVVYPFDPTHATVPGDDRAQWEAMVGTQGFAIHLLSGDNSAWEKRCHRNDMYYLICKENVTVLAHRFLQRD